MGTYEDYRAMLYTRHQAAQMGMPGMEPWPAKKAAKLMAILQVFGNNEGFTLSPKFIEDKNYIQDIYHINGCETPDPTFAKHLSEWVEIYDNATKTSRDFNDASVWIKQMYNFKLFF